MEPTINYTEVECGRYAIANGKHYFIGDGTENGWCYKDYNAWKTGEGVIYIGEYQLQEENTGYDDISALWTKSSWIEWVRKHIKDNYSDEPDFNLILSSEEFIAGLAYDCFEWCDWQDLSTMLYEFDYNDDWVLTNWEEYKKEHYL